MKPPKFLIAQNKAAKNKAAFIIHTQEPSFIAQVHEFNTREENGLFIENNQDKELIEVNAKVTIEIIQYLKSKDEENDKVFLKKKLIFWTRENFLKENDQ
jgi:hypothetical protein